MHSTVTTRVFKGLCNVPAIAMAVALMGVPGLGQLSKNVSSAGPSAAGLSALPPDAQGPVSAALGRTDSDYWVHRTVGGFRGANPRQALAAEFTREGVEVRSLTLSSGGVRWRVETRGYGYGDALEPVKSAAPAAEANRVEYRRDGVTEWYENGPMGLEQGFTLARAPSEPSAGNRKGGPLTLELKLEGDLTAALAPGGDGLELRRSDGEATLRYTGLNARDATGRALPSWLEVRGRRLLVRVEDAGALYPVVVDPWIEAELTASDGAAHDLFGGSVAISGSIAVVGAPSHRNGTNSNGGVAYVFVQNGGTWSQQAELTASDGAANDSFGASVAVSGSTAVVGAPGHKSQQGAAYVFIQNSTRWSQQAELTASDGAAGDQFGFSVAVSGSTAIVGAPYNMVGSNAAQGTAYVFVQNSTRWSQQVELTASDAAASNQFGYSVSVSGSTAVVGAPRLPLVTSGAAYVFFQTSGNWSQQQELTGSSPGTYDGFGFSVGVSGSTAVVGAPALNLAYVFVGSAGTWTQQQELYPTDTGGSFGSSVAVSGSTAVVGAPGHTAGTNTNQGAAYVFVQSGTTWSAQGELTASDGAANDQFGLSAAVSGSTPIVGASQHTVGSNAQQGAAYVFSTATGTSCNGIYTGTFSGSVTVAAGDSCEIYGGMVTGSLTSSGGTVILVNTTVTGTVQISGGSQGQGSHQHMVCASVIGGNLQFQSAMDPITVGGASGSNCGQSTIGGNLQVQDNCGSAVSVSYNIVGGELLVENNGGLVTVTNNITHTSLQVTDNSGGVIVDTNDVGTNLEVLNDSPSTAVFNNIVGGSLQCSGDSSVSGGGNTATTKTGQCASF